MTQPVPPPPYGEGVTRQKTEHAECPECTNDGPHVDNEDGTLECRNCYIEFDNPFYEADQTDRDTITQELNDQ